VIVIVWLEGEVGDAPRPLHLKRVNFGPDNVGIGCNCRSLIVECSPAVENYPPLTVIVYESLEWGREVVGGCGLDHPPLKSSVLDRTTVA
jgi:hypothetical protein